MEHLRTRGNEITLSRGKYTVGYENYLKDQYNGRFESRLNAWVFPSRMKYKLATFIQNIEDGRVVGNLDNEDIPDVDLDMDVFRKAGRYAIHPGKNAFQTDKIDDVPDVPRDKKNEVIRVVDEDPSEKIEIFNPILSISKFERSIEKLDRPKQILYTQAYKAMLTEGCRYPQWLERDVRKYAEDASVKIP